MAKTYWEKLKDPRWQKKRLEIMQRDEFKCKSCSQKEQTLNVHHRLYRKGKSPWEYEDDELVTLCEDCHKQVTKKNDQLSEWMAGPSAIQDAIHSLSEMHNGKYEGGLLASDIMRFIDTFKRCNTEDDLPLLEKSERDLCQSMLDLIERISDAKKQVCKIIRKHPKYTPPWKRK